MMGSMFAGTEEAPGEVILFQGRSYKSYRGMGSLGAMADGSADRYFQDGENNADKLVPEGIEGRVAYKGSVLAILYQLVGGVRSSMGYCGCATIEEFRDKAEFVEITSAGCVNRTCMTCRSPKKHQTTALTDRRARQCVAGLTAATQRLMSVVTDLPLPAVLPA